MIEWTTDLPTKPGRYFIRPAGSAHQGKVVTVSDFGGDLVAWAGPDLYEHFRMADLHRVRYFVNEYAIEWAYIDDVTDWEWNHAPEPSDVHQQDSTEAK